MTKDINKDHTLTKQLHKLTLNINGLHNDDKRMEFFQNVHNKNIDVTLLQETHTTPEISIKWEKEWKGKFLWYSGPIPKLPGIAILFKENLKFEIIHSETDLHGRILKCIIQIEKQLFQLIGIYVPTNPKNKQIFYKELPEFIEKGKNTILAGDFNMIEDIFLDKLGGTTSTTHLIGLNKLTEIKNEHNLVDTWRKTNPSKRLFTYHNPDKTKHSRLDRIYISETINTKTSQIHPTSLSHHDSVSCHTRDQRGEPKRTRYLETETSTLKQKNSEKFS